MKLRDELLGLLRVPPAPSAPAGDENVRVFRAAPNFFRYRVAQWILRQVGAFTGVIFGLVMLRGAHRVLPPNFDIGFGPFTLGRELTLNLVTAVEMLAIAVLVLQAIASLALLRLDFEQRWYLVSDRSLRIREGLLKLHEKTMTFANIQHVAIRQGPVQRLLGIADLEVRTAGGGGGSEEDEGAKNDNLHIAYFRGVANADRIRDGIRDRLRGHSDAGLGDPDDHGSGGEAEAPVATPFPAVSAPPGDAGGFAAAAAALRDEARQLRLALGSR
jgi:membrane protein YdbS with pleckstrin-like domain